MKFVIDTREKEPWDLGPESIRKKIEAGDYSIEGQEQRVAIERKTLDDLVNTVIHGRDRFYAELRKLAAYPHRCVVVEANLEDVLRHLYHSQAHPQSVTGTVISIIVDFQIPVFFCSNRQVACHFAKSFLERASRKEQQS
jgi:DNA excision repair protein ERCC-4